MDNNIVYRKSISVSVVCVAYHTALHVLRTHHGFIQSLCKLVKDNDVTVKFHFFVRTAITNIQISFIGL